MTAIASLIGLSVARGEREDNVPVETHLIHILRRQKVSMTLSLIAKAFFACTLSAFSSTALATEKLGLRDARASEKITINVKKFGVQAAIHYEVIVLPDRSASYIGYGNVRVSSQKYRLSQENHRRLNAVLEKLKRLNQESGGTIRFWQPFSIISLAKGEDNKLISFRSSAESVRLLRELEKALQVYDLRCPSEWKTVAETIDVCKSESEIEDSILRQDSAK